MDADERDVIQYLATWGEQFVHGKEVARKAGGKRRFNEDAEWAKPVLQRLTDHGVVEADLAGRYRLKPEHGEGEEWVAPDISKLLAEDDLDGTGPATGGATDHPA